MDKTVCVRAFSLRGYVKVLENSGLETQDRERRFGVGVQGWLGIDLGGRMMRLEEGEWNAELLT